MRSLLLVAVALGLVSHVGAQTAAHTARFCPTGDICYGVNVPDQTAASGSGDIFFQIQGPSTMQWIGLGQGEQMAGSNMFVIYASASGTNVTLSPRAGRGHMEPDFDAAAQASLLEGSGIADGKMTANVRCARCNQWSGGSMDLTSSTSNWIWAVKDGSPLNDDSQSAGIDEHDNFDAFSLDLTRARGGSSLNPFLTATPPGGPISGDISGAGSAVNGNDNTMHRATIAHGTLLSLVFVIIYPVGAMVIRLLSFRYLVWLHAGIQLFAYMLALAGLGLGVYIAVETGDRLGDYHPVIGLVIIGLLIFEPIFGQIHHLIYARQQRRSIWTTIHIWFGRVLITFGIIEGGLGLRYADNTTGGEIAYGVVAGVIWLIWMSVAVWSQFSKRRERSGTAGEKSLSSPHGHSSSGSAGEEEGKRAY